MWCRGLNAWTVRLLNRKIAFTEARLSAITSLAGDVDACSLDGECAFQMRASANLGPLESVLSDNDFSPQKLSELVNGTVRRLRCPHVWHAHHVRWMHAGTSPMRIHALPLLPSAAGPKATHICVRLKAMLTAARHDVDSDMQIKVPLNELLVRREVDYKLRPLSFSGADEALVLETALQYGARVAAEQVPGSTVEVCYL